MWKAPALNTELLRFTPEEVEQIITYGRPGTPMQAFGVLGGGAKNEQTIHDLVAYIQSIQLTPEEAQKEAAKALEDAQQQPQAQLDAAKVALDGDPTASPPTTGATGALDAATGDAHDRARRARDDEHRRPRATCKALETELDDAGTPADEGQAAKAKACRDFLTRGRRLRRRGRGARVGAGVARLAPGRERRAAAVRDSTARAATPRVGRSSIRRSPNSTRVLGLPGGGGGQGGGIGFNLRDGATIRRFGEGTQPGTLGFDAQVDFITTGSEDHKQYGNGGQGTGRMPGFGEMLTTEMINAIVSYERSGLDNTTYLAPATTTTVATTTTTTATTTTTGG